MAVEKLTYINGGGESISFSRFSVYLPTDVDGISNIANTIFADSTMGQDGDSFIASRIEPRDITITCTILERDPGKARMRRRDATHCFNPQLSGALIYEYGDFKRAISCKVSDLTFSKSRAYQKFVLQLRCLDPFWREAAETREDIAAWVGAFEFPINLPEQATWEIEYRQPSLIVNAYNAGDVRAGMRVEFRALGSLSNPSIVNVDTQAYIKFILEMDAGDVLTVTTGYGEKNATLLRGGIISDAIRYIDPDSTYLQLEPGDNLIRYDADDALENLEVFIYHNNLYLGV